jgi:hypothetical protein
MSEQLTVGLIVALVSMLGTLLALSFLAVMIAVLHRALPEREEPPPQDEASNA